MVRLALPGVIEPFTILVAVNLAAGLLLVTRASERVYGEPFAPLSLFLIVNVASFGLYRMALVPFYPTTAPVTAFFLVAVGGFAGGALLADPGVLRRGRSAALTAAPVATTPTDFVRRFYAVTGLLGLAGWLILGWFLSQRVSLLLVLANLWFLQDQFQSVPFIGYLNTLNILVPPAFVYLWRRCGYIRPWTVLLVVSGVIGLFLAGIKAYMVFSLIAAFFTYFSFRRGRRNVALLGLLLGVVFGFFVLYTAVIDIFLASSVRQWWVGPYLYVAAPWASVAELLTLPVPVNSYPGLHLLYPFWKVWNLFVPDPQFPSYVLHFVNTPLPFNTYTMNGESYLDFGWPGVLLFSTFLGWASTRVRLSTLRTDRFTGHLLSGLFAYYVFMSFFVNFITHFYSIIFLLYIAAWRRWERTPATRAA